MRIFFIAVLTQAFLAPQTGRTLECPPLYTFAPESAGDALGASVSGAGDVNNDGIGDVIVGAPGNDESADDGGKAYVYSGATGELLWAFTGNVPGGRFGASVSGAGDVNNDGFADVIVGTDYGPAVIPAAGQAYVYSGKDGSLLRSLSDSLPGGLFGGSVSGAGDVDDDGYDDVVVGAREYGDVYVGPGHAYVYSGRT